MWLLGRLAPDHKTIASFRSQNSEALVAVYAAFIQFARRAQLIAGTLVAIDGSKIRAVASKKAIYDVNDLAQDRQHIQEQISKYLAQLDQSDEQERANLLQGDIGKTLKKLETHAQAISQELQRLAQGRGKLSVKTEPQSQVMKSLHGAPGYNLQSTVDTASHLIVHHEVCRDDSDLKQLMPIAQGCIGVLQSKPHFIADAGYANPAQLKAMDEVGLISYVPPQEPSTAKLGAVCSTEPVSVTIQRKTLSLAQPTSYSSASKLQSMTRM